MPSDYDNPLVVREFSTLAEFQQGTGQDVHSVLVDWDIFLDVVPPDPDDPLRLYDPEAYDFRLQADSLAVDAGTTLSNINDNFTGAAPDLGALEVSQPLPLYGPRPE
jgi:hypothetical protein